jgi:hypothetical protein
MLRATRLHGKRTVSNIVWDYGHTTIPRHLRDIVVTEYGIADLRDKSDREIIVEMLSITDSRFQDGLLQRAKDAGKIERSFELPRAARDNTPDRIVRALGSARDSGLLPSYPFGTDFTATEQRLMEALALMRQAPSKELVTLLTRGMRAAAPSVEVKDCLSRMGLHHPTRWTDRIHAAIMRGALEAL